MIEHSFRHILVERIKRGACLCSVTASQAPPQVGGRIGNVRTYVVFALKRSSRRRCRKDMCENGELVPKAALA
jgi:hypothetical protein